LRVIVAIASVTAKVMVSYVILFPFSPSPLQG
jgi:hypothetical protein